MGLDHVGPPVWLTPPAASPPKSGKTLAIGKTSPEYGPESSSDAVDRLLEYYLKLDQESRPAFVAALIGELVMLKVIGRMEQRRVLAGVA